MNDALGDRMKSYEQVEAGRRGMAQLPLCVRLDGKNFSAWTRGLARPFDARLSAVMVEVTKKLVEATGACVGYTQSDEISLVLYSPDPKSELWFGGKFQKITSVTAAIATAEFAEQVRLHIPERVGRSALFDSRAWNVPTLAEAANTLLWRELDATKNSISMAARCYYSHAQLLNKSGAEMQEMLHAAGVNWNDYPAFFKRGVYVKRVRTVRRYTSAELDALPALHQARQNPDLEIERQDVREMDWPPLLRFENREAVLFGGLATNSAQELK